MFWHTLQYKKTPLSNQLRGVNHKNLWRGFYSPRRTNRHGIIVWSLYPSLISEQTMLQYRPT